MRAETRHVQPQPPATQVTPAQRAPVERLDSETLRRRWDLVLPHRDELLKIARRRVPTREDAEDVVATALLRTVEHPGLDETRVERFLCTTVIRLAVDVHRDRTRQGAVGVRDALRNVPAPAVDDRICDEAEAHWLNRQLSGIPARERQVLDARLSGLTAQQTSAHLGLTQKATENAFTRVRQRAHGLLAGTLAIMLLAAAHVRRLMHPAALAVPVVAAAWAGAVLAAPDRDRPDSSEQAPIVEQVSRPAGPGDVSQPPQAAKRGDVPAERAVPPADADPGIRRDAAVPMPERTTVRPPILNDRKTVDAGGAYVEKRREEPFLDSVQHCLSNVQIHDLTADPCR